MRPTLALMLALSLTASPTHAGCNAESLPDPSIAQVRTGGFWKTDQAYGTYRVVVRDLGTEHVQSQIFVQWLLYGGSTTGIAVERTIALNPLCERTLGVAREVVLSKEGDNAVTVLLAFEHSHVGTVNNVKLRLGAPGEVAMELNGQPIPVSSGGRPRVSR